MVSLCRIPGHANAATLQQSVTPARTVGIGAAGFGGQPREAPDSDGRTSTRFHVKRGFTSDGTGRRGGWAQEGEGWARGGAEPHAQPHARQPRMKAGIGRVAAVVGRENVGMRLMCGVT
ncbi:hypothetical protein GCM10022377_20230 [Zhihengliuella alba]|uniref:Uncharacterized protein n=1 Tax=Zhihengliuella alba TaxID=547018 RepID=A0ABP7DPD4_9MICC